MVLMAAPSQKQSTNTNAMTGKHKITLVPLGGLANRLRAIASGYELSKAVGSSFDVVWLKNKDLNCPFDCLFRPMEHGITLIESSKIDSLIKYNVPLKRNFYLPTLYQRRHFSQRLYDTDIEKLRDDAGAIKSLVAGKNSYIASGLPFYPTEAFLFRELFRPTDEITEEIKKRCSAFTTPTFGLHIRRTDNTVSIAESPITLFIQQIEQDLKKYPEAHFYLATDSEKVKERLRERFGNRILYSPGKADRNSIEGMKEAVAELYTLAGTHHFHGSYYSSFSDLVAVLSDRSYDILRKEI